MSDHTTADPQEKGLPRKRHGETFTQWWARLSEADVLSLRAVTHMIGVGPQSYFVSYVREAEDSNA